MVGDLGFVFTDVSSLCQGHRNEPAQLFISHVSQACSISAGIHLKLNSFHYMPPSSCFSKDCRGWPFNFFFLVLTMTVKTFSFCTFLLLPSCLSFSFGSWVPRSAGLLINTTQAFLDGQGSFLITVKESQVPRIWSEWCFTGIFLNVTHSYELMLPIDIGGGCWAWLWYRRYFSQLPTTI